VEVIGRQGEQERVDEFLDMLLEGPAALVLEGDSGIGKTTLWRAAVDAARRRSYRVLVCRSSESESALSFLGLGDLFESVSSEPLDDLPEPQRVALELALLRSSGEGSPDRVSLARGTLGVLRASAAEAPTVLAIDDMQWLDPPSADVLRFVAHRLTKERLGFLVSARGGGASSLELDHAFPAAGLVRVRLEPLSFEQLEEVVRLHLPVGFARPTWRALHRISGGNPFFALQLAEALERRGGSASSEGLPIPETLADAMRERLTALSPSARAALLPTAALAQPTLSLLRSAGTGEGIEEAIQAGVLQLEGERLRFAHPLLASFVYRNAVNAERQAVHRRLAPLVADAEEMALHLGRGAVEPDEPQAAILEATAHRAAGRGDPEVAAELAQHAARLTPAARTDDWARRARTAAAFLFAAGDGSGSRELLEKVIERLPASIERARALHLLGAFGGNIARNRATLEQALDEAGNDLPLRSQLLARLGMEEGFADHWDAASRYLREALEVGERSGSVAAVATARVRLTWAELGPDQLQEIDRAVELERSLSEALPFVDSPSYLQGPILIASDRLDEARRRLEEAYERALALGNVFGWGQLSWLAEVELRAGNWQRALAYARAAERVGRQSDNEAVETWATWPRALVEAHLGNIDAAIEAGERGSRLARSSGFHLALTRSELALGFLYLSAGQGAAALDHLLPPLEEQAGVSLHRSQVARTLSNAIEALVGAGALVEADSMAARLEEHARSMPVPSAIAAAARCRALTLAQNGDLSSARASIEAALAAHARLDEPFELARTYLVQGSIERRAKQKAEAREALGRAEAIFARLGARLWLERVERELARTGLTRSLDRELTPTELRVAELAAAGAQNKQIAGALFVSLKTVEANLSRVYAKLGIRSRTELASQLSKRNTQVGS
jgi:DNA-binding CsgD family transcriptional regulator